MPYQHPRDPKLNDLHQSMDYTEDGKPAIRVLSSIQGDIIIEGSVTIPGEVTVSGTVSVDNFPATQTVDGIVNIGTMPEVEIKNDTGNPIPVSGTVSVNQPVAVTDNGSTLSIDDGGGSITVDGTVTANITGTPTFNFNGTNVDAFGRLRVSNPFTLFDSSVSGEPRGDFDTVTANGGQWNYNFDANVRELSVTTTSGSSVDRQTYRVFNYQPGKSLLVMNTVCFSAPQEFLYQRVGYFDDDNGVFLELAEATFNFVIRSSSSGSLAEERIDQSSWNVDVMDGTGPSGKTLNITAPQIFWTDIEWLGVGTVRCGFVIDGEFIVCHKFHHANVMDGDTPKYPTTYMSTARLPIRYTIFTTNSILEPAMMQQICSTVISEGGFTPTKITRTAGTGINVKRLTTAGTYYPVASIRFKAGKRYSVARVSQIDILSPTVNYYRWVLLRDATLTGATWLDPSASDRVEVDTAATAVSGGTEIESGFVSSREAAVIDPEMFQGWLGFSITGTAVTYTLAMVATSNNADVLAQIGWQEIA